MTKLIRLMTIAAVATAAMLVSAAPASAATNCPDGYDLVVADNDVLLAADWNDDGQLCVGVFGDYQFVTDNSILFGLLPSLIPLPNLGFTISPTIDIGSGIDAANNDQRGNRNSNVAVAPVCNNTTGNGCVANWKVHPQVKFVVLEDADILP